MPVTRSAAAAAAEERAQQEADPKAQQAADDARGQLCGGACACHGPCTCDPCEASPYCRRIYLWRRARESLFVCDADPLRQQKHLNVAMRQILYCWLLAVRNKYFLTRATWFRAVHFLDRFCSTHKHVPRRQYQLYGCAALLLASKFEERRPVEIWHMTEVCADAYSSHTMAAAERLAASVLNWNLAVPTVHYFAAYFVHMLEKSRDNRGCLRPTLLRDALMYACCALFEPPALALAPSALAFAAVYLSIHGTAHNLCLSKPQTRAQEEAQEKELRRHISTPETRALVAVLARVSGYRVPEQEAAIAATKEAWLVHWFGKCKHTVRIRDMAKGVY